MRKCSFWFWYQISRQKAEIRKQKNYLIYTYYQVYWTQELYDYLVANAKMVEVVEPAIIRENVIARLQSGLANYDE